MKKKILIFLAINSSIAAMAAMAPLSLMNGEGYLRVAVVHDFVEGVEPGEKLNVILGDSRSDCCVAGEDIRFINLSYQGASPVEGYYLLERLIERGAKVEKLILSFGPFHIFTQDAFHAQTRYFGLIDESYTDAVLELAAEKSDTEYLEYHWRALEVLDESIPWLPDSLKFRLVNVMSINRTIEAVWAQSSQLLLGPESNASLRAAMEYKFFAAVPPDRTNADAASPEYEKPEAVSPVNEFYLAKLVALAKQHHVSLRYMVMPFNRDVLHPEQSYYDRYYGILEQAGLGACSTPPVWWPNDRFADAHHLNVSGTQEFGALLRKHVNYCN